MEESVVKVETKPFDDQNPGTSGLRKKCLRFLEPNYTENFLQSIYQSIHIADRKNGCLVIGGDGRYFCREASIIAVRMAAANGFSNILLCQGSLGSTPSISHMIRKHSAIGGIILTASHNPGGYDKDFGIKFNMTGGGGAPEDMTKLIYKTSKCLQYYKTCINMQINIDECGYHVYKIRHSPTDVNTFKIQVIDPTIDYIGYMKEIFDFSTIKQFLSTGFDGNPIILHIDSRNGIAGIYVQSIFQDWLHCPREQMVNCTPLQDFGGLHPDPNLTYASDFVENVKTCDADFAAAFDGDADRCMIIGKNGYPVSPSDSVAIIAANATICIPYFKINKYLVGVARSMPTSSALDRVAEVLSKETGHTITCYEVPTGWKFFCNLMDVGKVDICGEESFGAGSNHIREKDGIWVAIAWLSIMATTHKSVQQLVQDHWLKFGRHFYTRYDYEDLSTTQGEEVMNEMESFMNNFNNGIIDWKHFQNITLALVDNFSYTDTTNNSVSAKQGYRVIFTNKDRIIVRLSGTGSSGATVRIYIEHFENDPKIILLKRENVLKNLIDIALWLTKIHTISDRMQPTVIT